MEEIEALSRRNIPSARTDRRGGGVSGALLGNCGKVVRNMRKNLKEARKRAGMTQKQVAEYLDMSVRMYQRIEFGSALGKITHWDKLEDLFNVPQRQLREQTENPSQPDSRA